jgi:hypothetical protein
VKKFVLPAIRVHGDTSRSPSINTGIFRTTTLSTCRCRLGSVLGLHPSRLPLHFPRAVPVATVSPAKPVKSSDAGYPYIPGSCRTGWIGQISGESQEQGAVVTRFLGQCFHHIDKIEGTYGDSVYTESAEPFVCSDCGASIPAAARNSETVDRMRPDLRDQEKSSRVFPDRFDNLACQTCRPTDVIRAMTAPSIEARLGTVGAWVPMSDCCD